jgi:general secretion pathway protein A
MTVSYGVASMYSDYFGFAELPFSVTPDPRFSYTNSNYREAFATLRYGIETRKGFIAITGEAGTGKTTLLRRLMRSVEATVHTAFIFNTHLSFTELLRLVLNDLGVPNSAQDRLTLMAQLNDYLIEQLRGEHIVSLLIDEAQDLSNEMLEELRLLSNLETDNAKLIQIVLMGQPELERKLDQPQLRQLKQRVAVRCRLAPLRSDEVALYINSRLQTVGYEGKELFDLGSVQKIALYSKGIPRLINVICDNALLIAYATSKSTVSAKIIDDVARDLQLIEPSQVKGAEQLEEISRPTKASYDDESWRRDFEQFPGLPANKLYDKRNWAGAGIAIALAVMILAGTVLYSQQSGSLAALAVNLEDLVSVRWKNPLQTQSPENTTEEDAARLNRHHVEITASRGSEFVLDSPNGDSLVFSRIERKKAQASPPTVDSRSLKSETPVATSGELDKHSPSEAKNKTKERSSGTHRVYDASFVRDKPRSDANITGTLEPGTRIKVQSKTGDYFRVRSLDREPISGYVHREDAFFEPAR